jgi:hypothetical protein
MFWRPTLAVCADVGFFLQELSLLLVDYKCSPDWLQQLRDRDTAKEELNHTVTHCLMSDGSVINICSPEII